MLRQSCDVEYDDVIRALLPCVWTVPNSNLALLSTKPHRLQREPKAGAHPGAKWSVSSTGEVPSQVEEAFWAIQEENACCEEGETTVAGDGADTWSFLLGL